MDRYRGKVAIVTGASAGIGASITEKLVKEGMKVVGLEKRKDRLDQQAAKLASEKGKFYPIKTDVTKEEDILSAFNWVKQNLGPIHVLVNNAGIFKNANLIDGETKIFEDIIKTNVLGLCIATREAVKDMRANNVDGQIIHINSVLGHNVFELPGMNVYPASKHAITALTETLRLELNSIKSNIKITSISPGAVQTEIVAEVKASEASENIFRAHKILDPEDIADGVLYVLSTPPHVQVHELTIKPIGEVF